MSSSEAFSTLSPGDRERRILNLARLAVSGSTLSGRQISSARERLLKGPREMNTYRLESKSPFQSGKVQTIIEEVLVAGLQEVNYDPQTAPALAMSLSAEIRTRVKQLQFDRYKLVCVVEIGEKQQQSVYSAFRFLWDADRDSYAVHRYENYSLFAVGVCFGVYQE